MTTSKTTLYHPAAGAEARVAELAARLARGDRGLRAVVVGAGKSGVAAMELLLAKGAQVTLADDRTRAALEADASVAPLLARVSTSAITADVLGDADLVVLSPGVPRARPELAGAIERGVLVGEIELASWFVKAPIVAITGTNGKSTTTALIGHLVAEAGLRVFTGGNLGDPLANLARSGRDVDVAVVELSSFQLESLVSARFEAALWLNLTPDHAERYADLDTYAAAKERIFELRTPTGVAITNAADPWCVAAIERQGGRVRWFSSELPGSEAHGAAEARVMRDGGTALVEADVAVRGGERYSLANPAQPGLHNRANMIAAIEAARHVGVPAEAVARGLLTFRGLPHRIELVGTIDGVAYYNDSKATNVDSSVIAVRALPAPKILIAGGKDKGAPWAPLVDASVRTGVKAVLAIGKTPKIVLDAFTGVIPIVEDLGTLEAALVRARALAVPGDAVLLSPACASYDQFKHFEHRGDVFRALVAKMGEGR
ncbi:UDP-N-acetylmuramoyl-L-alanine--D-glutamate ligase [Myxococcota bacterium]|nr:UDP-N-acetylmuramoyl-L-alanine--D-glutamate ligase [Myxococcota bacterium]